MNRKGRYGMSLLLDLTECDTAAFTRESIEAYMVELCHAIDMQREDLHFWDDVGVPPEQRQTDPRTSGTSAVQFILTSSIVIHALDMTGELFVDLFSCKEFDSKVVIDMTRKHFHGDLASPATLIGRGKE